MKHNYTFYEVPKNLISDPLTDFISELSFIPHGFGHQFNDPRAACNERITGDFELIYIIGGESYITIGQQDYKCECGDAVLIPPFTMHKIQTPAANPHDNYWIHFDVRPFYRNADFQSMLLENGRHILHAGVSRELLSLYQNLEEEVNSNKPGSMVFFKTILVQILTMMARSNKTDALNKKMRNYKHSPETEIVNKSMEWIQSNLSQPIRIADICHQLHVSESYLFKAFDHVLGMTPNHFIQIMKIKRAEQLMKSTVYTFKEISDMLGFSSPFYFSSVFKKYYQVSPREYMKYIE